MYFEGLGLEYGGLLYQELRSTRVLGPGDRDFKSEVKGLQFLQSCGVSLASGLRNSPLLAWLMNGRGVWYLSLIRH